jgi:hypothetical protein
MSEQLAQPTTPQRFIVLSPDGKIDIVGRWRVGEILIAAQTLANVANGIEVETEPAAKSESTNQGATS